MKMKYHGDGDIRYGDLLIRKGDTVDLTFCPSKNFEIIEVPAPEPVESVKETKRKKITETAEPNMEV